MKKIYLLFPVLFTLLLQSGCKKSERSSTWSVSHASPYYCKTVVDADTQLPIQGVELVCAEMGLVSGSTLAIVYTDTLGKACGVPKKADVIHFYKTGYLTEIDHSTFLNESMQRPGYITFHIKNVPPLSNTEFCGIGFYGTSYNNGNLWKEWQSLHYTGIQDLTITVGCDPREMVTWADSSNVYNEISLNISGGDTAHVNIFY